MEVAPRPLISRGDLLPRGHRHVAQQGVQGLLGDLPGGLQGAVPDAGLAVDAHAHGHLVLTQLEVGMAHLGDDAGVRAKPTVRVLSLASWAAASTSSRVPPSSALQPAALNMK